MNNQVFKDLIKLLNKSNILNWNRNDLLFFVRQIKAGDMKNHLGAV